jgi:tRNA threonylcarbamoyladenosine biosynthesis protein TsaE
MTQSMTPRGTATHGLELYWQDEQATAAWAAHMAQSSHMANACITLEGDLGAGKTTLTRHLLKAMGVQGRIKSPTYAVVEPYEVPAPNGDASSVQHPARHPTRHIWHFDFYRFNSPDEWIDAGFRDIFASQGLKLVEWPQKAHPHLPTPDVCIGLRTLSECERQAVLQAYTPLGLACVEHAKMFEAS